MVMAAHIACGCWRHDSGGCVSLFGYCVLVFASSRATWKGSAIGSGLPEWWCWLVGLRQGKLLCVKLHGGVMDTGKATRLLYPPSSWTNHRSVTLYASLSMLSTVCSLWLLIALPPSTSDKWGNTNADFPIFGSCTCIFGFIYILCCFCITYVHFTLQHLHVLGRNL